MDLNVDSSNSVSVTLKNRVNHNFSSSINSSCSCSLKVESAKYFFLRCHHYIDICKTRKTRKTLLNAIEMIEKRILNVNDERFDKSLFRTKTYILPHRLCVTDVLRFYFLSLLI